MLFHMIAGPPKPVGPFSHAVEVYGTVFVTGQMPDMAEMPGLLPDGIEAQTQCHVKSDDCLVWSEPWSGEHRNGAHLANAVSGRQYRTEYGLPELFFGRTFAGSNLCRGDGVAYYALIKIDF